MATDKYPNQNVNMPMTQARIDMARARLTPQFQPHSPPPPANGKGSRREVRPGEFVDDRVIDIGGPSSPSADSPPEMKGTDPKAVPSSYDPLMVYQVTLGKSVEFSGRWLSPGKEYQMVGAACTEISAAIIDAVELGAIPADPDATPSAAPASKSKKA